MSRRRDADVPIRTAPARRALVMSEVEQPPQQAHAPDSEPPTASAAHAGRVAVRLARAAATRSAGLPAARAGRQRHRGLARRHRHRRAVVVAGDVSAVRRRSGDAAAGRRLLRARPPRGSRARPRRDGPGDRHGLGVRRRASHRHAARARQVGARARLRRARPRRHADAAGRRRPRHQRYAAGRGGPAREPRPAAGHRREHAGPDDGARRRRPLRVLEHRVRARHRLHRGGGARRRRLHPSLHPGPGRAGADAPPRAAARGGLPRLGADDHLQGRHEADHRLVEHLRRVPAAGVVDVGGRRRRHRAQAARGAVPAVAEDGGDRPARRRHRARLQQPAHRRAGLHRRHPRRDLGVASAPAGARAGQARRRARRGPDPPAAAVHAPAGRRGARRRSQRHRPRARSHAAAPDRRGPRARHPHRRRVLPDQDRPGPDRAGADEPGGQRPRRHAAGRPPGDRDRAADRDRGPGRPPHQHAGRIMGLPARVGQRHRHGPRHAGPHLRAVLHHQGAGPGHRSRPGDGVRHRPAERRPHRGLQHQGRRLDLLDLPAADRRADDARAASTASRGCRPRATRRSCWSRTTTTSASSPARG